MFGDKSNNIFWNMIKNKKTIVNPSDIPNSDEFSLKKSYKRATTLSMRTLSQYDSESMKISEVPIDEDPIKIIDKLSTYAKICILQGLLKEMKSIRERFIDNQRGMLEVLEKNCFNYYKSKVGIKEVFYYCESNRPEEHIDYVLIENCKEYFKEKYEDIFNFIFLLRNSNEIMLHIVRNCRPDSYEELSDIIVNLFYEDTINSTFNFEELLTLIYLIIEELVMKKLPSNIASTDQNDIITNYLRNNILYSIFKSLTKKVDVRNFLCSVLTEVLLKIEGYRENISIEIKTLLTEMKIKRRDSQMLEQFNFQGLSSQNMNFKKCNSSVITTNIGNDLAKKKNLNEPRVLSFDTTLEQKSKLTISNTFDEREGSLVFNRKTESQSFANPNELVSTGTFMSTLNDIDEEDENFEIDENINFEEIQLDNTLWETNSVSLDLLKKKLAEYEIKAKNNKNNAFSAMMDFINVQIKECSIDEEKFSNDKKIKSIKTFLKLKRQTETDTLIEALDKNYIRITNFINEVLDRLKDNITSLPYLIKSIMLIIEVLIQKKYPNNQKITTYQKYMFLSNFLVGNILLPLITNPDYTGIVTTDIISKVTKNNLNIIAKIFKKILSGHLFDSNTESEYTIFNKFLIEVLQKIFEVIDSIPHNMKLPNSILKLLDNMNNPNRNINYNYFEQYKQENIQQQSACFSWFDLFFLSDSINRCKESLSENSELKKNIPTFDKFVNLEKYFRERYFECVKSFKNEFFYLSKINYNPTFSKKISVMLDENYGLFSNPNNINVKKNEEILFFKKCLIEVLAYVNKLHKENFNYFVQKNKEHVEQDSDVIKALLRQIKQKEYNKVEFEGDKRISFACDTINKKERSSIIFETGIDITGNEDADFKETLIPQIVDIAKTEIGNNLDNIKSKRVIFSCSYLQVHIDDLPTKYKENNYSLLLIEIIKEIEAEILELKTNILNQYYLKVRGAEKLNMITTSNYNQIKRMEKCICIQYLFSKLRLPCKLNVHKDKDDIITKVEYQPVDIKNSYVKNITSFLNIVPNFRKYEDKVDDIVDLEEKVEMDVALNSYFKDLRNLVKKEKIIQRFSHEEYGAMANELENYILFKLYDKLFPENSTKDDIKFYKKCVRLDWVKPENLIKDKKIINEKLWKTSMDLINEMDEKLTPADKLKCFGKAFSILQNSITFCSGKKDLGIDDTIPSLIYVILKSKPKNIFTNSKYCQLLLNPDLSKKQYGILLSQIEMIKNIIYEMKHTDLIGVTEEQFKKGEEEEEKKESS